MVGRIYITNSADGVNWRTPRQLGRTVSGEVYTSMCEGPAGNIVVAYNAYAQGSFAMPTPYKKGVFYNRHEPAVFIVEVSPDLSFPTKKIGGKQEPLYNFWAPHYRDVQIFKGDDGAYTLIYRYAIARDRRKAGEVYGSAHDMSIRRSFNLRSWKTYSRVVTDIHYDKRLRACMRGNELTIIRQSPDLFLKTYDLRKVMKTAKERELNLGSAQMEKPHVDQGTIKKNWND